MREALRWLREGRTLFPLPSPPPPPPTIPYSVTRVLDLIAVEEGPWGYASHAEFRAVEAARLDRMVACGLHDYLRYRISAVVFYQRLAGEFDGLSPALTTRAAVFDALNHMRP